ncbi:MAG: sigma-70 family RNA polymerase sigma factor [Isosphaeraceae bacterium]
MRGLSTSDAPPELAALLQGGVATGLTDRELLERFATSRDQGGEFAFAALVARHGPMVKSVCGRMLPNPADAEDAFQATFLVLVQRAGSIRLDVSLGPWLYGVSVRVARRARVVGARRHTVELADEMAKQLPDRGPRANHDLRLVIDEELARLPESFRAPIVLCHMQGLTHEEAADRLRCPIGTVRSRLARGRALLKNRLERSELGLLAGPGAWPALNEPPSSVARYLIDQTVRIASRYAAGQPLAGISSAGVASLVTGVTRAMTISKLAAMCSLLLFAGLGAFEVSRLAAQTLATTPALADRPRVVKAVPDNGATAVDPATRELRITFDQDMDNRGYSFVGGGPAFPGTGRPRWIDARTCVLPLRLAPDHEYQLSINSQRFQNFRGKNGEPSVPYPIQFKTGKGKPGAMSKPGPADDPVDRDVLAEAFDALWNDMDLHYSYFELKKIDWPALKRKYRSRAVAADTLPAFVSIVGQMLGELDDDHVWFTEPDGATITRTRKPWRYNGNARATESAIENRVPHGKGFAQVGFTRPEGFGVIRVIRQSQADADAVRAVVAFIRLHSSAPGFILDLRLANGGSEPLAQQIAREFCARDTVYAKSKYRNGPTPADFGPAYERILKATERPFTKPVVCILGPGCVSSGEGFAKMMKCLPNVTTVGLPTRGSSGNPKPFTLPGVAVTVVYSRWVDMLPDGTPIEGRGVRPDVIVDEPESAYQETDPTWDRAVELLRVKTKKAG